MKKLSESFIDDVIRRSRNDEDREEDQIHWVDFGDFYLADRLYEKDGNIYFTYEETMEMFPEGGEIGLLDEYACEKLMCELDSIHKSVDIWRYDHPEKTITLPLSGANDIPQSKTQTIVWIYGKSERHPDENVRCCVFGRGKGINKGNVLTSDIDKKAKVVILLMKKKETNESFIDDVIRRSRNDEKRDEEKSPFDKGFELIQKAEPIDLPGLGCDYFWTPFNFGSDSIENPGDYMTADEIYELAEYLKDTDYRIACNYDFSHLSMCKPDLVKIGKYWHYKFSRNGAELDIPIFGYISTYSLNDEVVGTTKRDCAYFGSPNEYMSDKVFEYTGIKIREGQFVCERHTNWRENSEKTQVRLIKKIHK